MSDDEKGINLILPDDMGKGGMDAALSNEGLTPEQLQQAQINAEMKDLEGEIEDVTNTEALPYHPDAPLCAEQVGKTAIARQTEYLGVVQFPAWTHGRCIGPLCHRWLTTKRGGICGVKLQELQAGKSLKVITAEEVDKEFARWPTPAEDADTKSPTPKVVKR